MTSIFAKQTWRIQEIVRGVGYPDLITSGLDGHFELQQQNLLSASEDLGNASVWASNSAIQFQYYDPALGAAIQDVAVTTTPAMRDPGGFWVTLGDQLGRVTQRVAVAPGEVYNLSFYAGGVADFGLARLAIFNADTGTPIVAPLVYGTQLSGSGAFVRIVQSFLVPQDCTFVRIELISDALPFSLLSDTDQYAEYVALAPASFVESTDTLQIGTQTITLMTATPADPR